MSWPPQVVQLLMLRPIRLPNATAASVVALALISFATWILLDWFANRPDPQFNLYGISSLGWYVLLTLAVAAVLARCSKPRVHFDTALVLVLVATPLVIVVTRLIVGIEGGTASMVASIAALIYFAAYAARGLQAATGRNQTMAAIVALLLTVAFIRVADRLYIEPSLWVAAEEADTDYEKTWQQAEALLFAQPARIDRAVAALNRPPGDAPAVFFLGFAGMGEQRVFAEEIELASRIIGARYGSQDRHLLLINDRRDLDSQPLASPTALRYALRGVATRMDLDTDVLFLSLSSHGSEDATLSVSNGPLMLHDLSAADLAAALDESAIKWRVIVISACYSGAFIEPLKNPQTVVITASAADRTSFGCSDDRDLTYFGEALYRDTLPTASSLRAAFAAASDEIQRRERQEGITASRPQAFFGEEIEKKLSILEKQ